MSDPVFEAAENALAALFEGDYEAPEPQAEAPVVDTPPLTIDDQGNMHGPDGKFTSVKETQEVIAPVEDDPEGSASEPTGDEPVVDNPEEGAESTEDEDIVFEVDDPEILAFLDKYDGDVLKALKAATEGQSLIGRQGSELGELRELKEQFSYFQEELERQRMVSGIDWNEAIEEDPEQAANLAVEVRDPIALQKAVEAWGEENPFQAMMFMNRLSMMAAEEAASQGPVTDLAVEMESLKERHPDIQQYLPKVQEILAEKPYLAQALQGEDPRTRVQALEDALVLAKSQSKVSDTSVAARKIILQAKADADKARADAAVVGASKSSAAEAVKPKPNEKLEEYLGDIFGEPVKVI